MNHYHTAQICENGHVLSPYGENLGDFCVECSAKTITHCLKCNTEIRGFLDCSSIMRNYRRPYFCHHCGEPYPWTKSKLESLLTLIDMDADVDEAERKFLKDNSISLIVNTPKSKVAAVKLKSFLHKSKPIVAAAIKELLVEIAPSFIVKLISE